MQNLGHAPERIVDVAHNPQAARVLASWLDAHPVVGRVHAVFGALADKNVAGVLQALGSRIARWHLGGLEQVTPRGLASADLAERVAEALPQARLDAQASIAAAWRAALEQAEADNLIVAFGSFFVVAEVLALEKSGEG
jgi:dihydrofolate synthase/folylpolyglutamate synthase